VPAAGSSSHVKNLVSLRQPEVSTLVELLKTLPFIPLEGAESVRVDDSLVRDLFADPESLVTIYREDPDRFQKLIADDTSARDVIAIAARREQVKLFRRFLEDDSYFDSIVEERACRPEDVWQYFFEENPWIFGVSLAGQFLTSWNQDRLEQIVSGASVAGFGKRTDALLRTCGRVRSMVFAEIKTHRTNLLGVEYRSGCWPPSQDLVRGITQVQGTVHRAVTDIGERLGDRAPDGSDIPGRFAYMLRPRSYLVVGSLEQLTGLDGGDNQDKIRSFELFRRQLTEPEIVTFDELLARAEWVVETA
jgi:Domain of unknown function (DUF4263)